ILSVRVLREPGGAGAGAASGVGSSERAGVSRGRAFTASSLVIRPSLPVPFTSPASTPFSARILAAAGEGCPAAYDDSPASDFGSAAVAAGALSFWGADPS